MASSGSPQRHAKHSRHRRWATWASLGMVAAGCALLSCWWFRTSRQPKAEGGLSWDAVLEAPVAASNPGYLGMQACAACHAKRVSEFQLTRHFQACSEPRAERMPRGFDVGRSTFRPPDASLRFEMTRRGGEFFETAIRTTDSGPEQVSARIDFVYGAGGNADEVYLTWHDDRLRELPMVWLHPQECWGASPIDRHGSEDFSREMTPRCLECHNTWFGHVAGTSNQYDRHSCLVGVSCERCHGPGREHVALHTAQPGGDAADEAVVHPGHLSRERQLEVCTQCHSNATKRRGPAFSYRPGEPLGKYYRTAVGKHPENDHVANQIKYLRASKCFQASPELTCTTCHDPHRPADPGAVQRNCLRCHESAACPEQERLPTALRSNCVGCHMPQRVWMNVHFHTEADGYVPPATRHEHRIAVYPAARQEVLLGWHRTQDDAHSRQEAALLSDILVAHWLAQAESYRREHRFLAAIGALREAMRVDPAPATRDKLRELVALQARLDADLVEAFHQIEEHRFPQAIETLQGILAVKPELAEAHGKLGAVYAIIGQGERAAEHLRAVAAHDPDDPYGYAMLGWLAYLQDKAGDAADALGRADEIEPFNAKVNFHLGLALLKLGRLTEAADRFRNVLTIDPRHAGGCQGLADVLRELGQAGEALRYAERAARLTRFENADVLLTLAQAYAGVGRLDAACETAARALDMAKKHDSRLAPMVQHRLEELLGRARASEGGSSSP